MADLQLALTLYDRAFEHIRTSSMEELQWQQNVEFNGFTESDMLRETAWVILCSGFREKTVHKLFDYISLCFCDWESAEAIVLAQGNCVATAASAFGNLRKLQAISDVAARIHYDSFATMKASILQHPIPTLQTLPQIGPITSFHLAKNLGLDVAKADRHLVRLSDRLGFSSCSDLCDAVSQARGESIKVVDLVFWRSLVEQVI